MPPTAPADQPTAGNVHDLISALKPDQERLAQLSKQLQQMENKPGFMDKLKAFRHGGMENAMEKLRDQIAGVQQEMFNKVSQDPSPASRDLDGAQANDPDAPQNEMTKLQDQLAIDDHFKQAGMPGLLDEKQRRDVERLVQENTRKLETVDRRQQGQDGPKDELGPNARVSVRASLAHPGGPKAQQKQPIDEQRPRGQSL